jgi:hypothetical protein
VVLGHLCDQIFLALQQIGDIALELDEFASDSFRGTGTDEAPAHGSRKDSGGKNCKITQTHGHSS